MPNLEFEPNEDGHYYSPSNFDTAGAVLTIGNIFDGTNHPVTDFLRFTSVTIPNAATINSAFIRFHEHTGLPSSTGLNTTIQGEDVDNATAISGYSDGTSRVRTSASVSWTVPTSTGYFDTVDFKSVIQEIVDRAGWASGNALQVFIKGFATGTQRIKQVTSDNSISQPLRPVLHISYDDGSPGENNSPFLLFM